MILEAAKKTAQAHGYGGLNFRDLALSVGIKSASIYYHFPGKAELGAAVAKRYREDSAAELEALLATAGPQESLRQYPGTFRRTLESDNRMCLCSYMAAESDDLPEAVRTEAQGFADVNIAWLSKVLTAAGEASAEASIAKARAIYAAIVGAQLLARSRADLALYDTLIDSYRTAGLLPA